MKPRYTNEQFIARLKEVHAEKYDYSKVVYTGCKDKITVGCPVHGDFLICPVGHRQGAGCFKCAHAALGLSKRLTQEGFLHKAREIHGDKYDYSLVKYDGQLSKIKLVCNEHGEFETTAGSHLSGSGCAQCGYIKRGLNNRSNTEEFVRKATELHSGKYTYELVEYSTNSSKVSVSCKVHGPFKTQPSNHLMGKGCPKCQRNGYNKGKPGSFYILASGNLTKVGITNRDVNIRAKDISKSSGEDFKINSSLFFEEGTTAANLELGILHWLQETHKPVDKVFDGSTECFLDVDLPTLLNKVVQVLNVSPN